MKEIQVNSSTIYKVIIGNGLRNQISDYLVKEYSSIMIITDDTVGKLYLKEVVNHFKEEKVYYSIIPLEKDQKELKRFISYILK